MNRLLCTFGPRLSFGAIVTGPVHSKRFSFFGDDMGNELQVFSYQSAQVRTVVVNGAPHFVAADVCGVLDIANVTDALKRLDDDERTLVSIEGAPNGLPVNAVTEAGLYSLILGSRKPEAKAFKRWVTHEVLPAIRQSGRYEAAPAFAVPQTLPQALRLAADLAERVEEQQRLLAAAQPKVEFFDAVTDSQDAIPIGAAAKVLNIGIGQNRLFAFLRVKKVLMTNNLPMQEYIDRGWFRVIEQKYAKPDGSTHIYLKTLVFQRGLDGIRRLWTRSHGGLRLAQAV